MRELKFKELIDELEEIIEDAGKIPLSGGKCLINKEELFGVIEQIRLTYPEDLKQAEYVKKERGRILQDAEKEAKILTDEAKNKVAKMVDDSEIVRLAKEKAAEIIKEAQDNANQIFNQANEQATAVKAEKKKEIDEYQDEVLSYIVSMLQKTESSSEHAVTTIAKAIDDLNKQYDAIRNIYEKVAQSRMNMLNQG